MTSFNLPLVSLIIPTHNRCALLRQAVVSALAQTYPALEIIVVNDGSTDGTATFLAEYKTRIKVITQPNQGVVAARNHGIKAAQGYYLTFLDDDDWLATTKVAQQVAFLAQHPDMGLVHCSYHKCDSEGQLVEKTWLRPQSDFFLQLVGGNFVWSGGPLIRREYMEKVGGYAEKVSSDILSCEDWDLWLRLAHAGCQFGVIQQPLGTYRLQPHSLVTNFAQLEKAVLTVLQRTFAMSDLPVPVAAAKPLAYAHMHLWLSARGLAGGQTEAGSHHLIQALHNHPAWRGQPETLLPLLRGHALDARVTAPPKFITDLFAHLPDEAEFLRPHHPWLLAYAHLGLALRYQASGNDTAAHAELTAALHTYPAFTHRLDDLAPFLTQYALSLPVEEPVRFAAAVLSQLSISNPSNLGDVALGWAFQAYYAGELRFVPRRVLMAWRYRPALLKNRGSWAIFLKSFRRQGGGYAL